jgi:hypothetical protein
VNWWFVMLIVALAFGLLAFFWIDDVNASFRRVGETIQCSVPGGLYGECLGSSSCDGRAGWKSYGAQRCPDEQPVCCILDEPAEWFTQGSVILNTIAKDTKLLTDAEFQYGPTTVNREPLPLKLKQRFSIIYVPNKEDKVCEVFIQEKLIGRVPKEGVQGTCYDLAKASWPVPRGVVLMDSTGESLFKNELKGVEGAVLDGKLNIRVKTDTQELKYQDIISITK